MKFVVYVALAASLFAIAAAVTSTDYSDSACKTAVPTAATAPNPFVFPLNTCAKYAENIYGKATACGGGKVTTGGYSDANCATALGPAAAAYDTDKCILAEGGKYRIYTCASTSSVTVAFLAVAAAVLALSF